MHAESPRRWWRTLTIVIPFLALTGCGEGDGPTSIPNTAVPPLDLPLGFCDPINFEVECDPPAIIWFGGGQTVVIDNPDKSGINTSDRVARMQKFFDQPFGGTRLDPREVPVNFSAGEAYKIKVWSERSVPVLFKLEETNDGTLGVAREVTHGGGSTWEELCFDFTGATPANTIGLTIIFENGSQGGAIGGVFEGDWTFYYDDITQVESCAAPDFIGIVPDVKLYDPTATPPIPVDVETTGFGSESVIDPEYAADGTYSQVLAVSSGVGYAANVAQIGFIDGDRGFASDYESLDFKVKGMPNNIIFVKLFDAVDSLRINLTSSAYSEELGDGWFQVSIPISAFNGVSLATGLVFESDNTAPMQFTMLLNDIGFSDAGGGDGGDGVASLGVFSETNTDPVVSITDYLSIGNTVAIDAFSTAVTPFDGTVSLELAFSTGAQTFGGAAITFDDADLSAYDTLKFAIDTSTFAGFVNLTVQLEPPGGGTEGGNVSLASYTPVATSGNWNTYEIPLADFTAVNPSVVNVLGFFNARDGSDVLLAGTLYLDDIHFTTAGGGGTGGGGVVEGNIAINGGFETGQFNDGTENASWQQFPGGGTQTIVTTNPFEGTYAANLNVPVRGVGDPAVDNLIKNANLQAGNLTPNSPVTVTWYMRGSLEGAGGVVFVELFSEQSGGGTSKSEIYTDDPIAPDADPDVWTAFTWNTTLGSDVGGGVTLQLKVGCGDVPDCGADIYFDNVSIVVN